MAKTIKYQPIQKRNDMRTIKESKRMSKHKNRMFIED